MRIIFAVLLFFHGILHLPGFVKAFGFADIKTLSKPISKNNGAFWLLAFLIFTLSGVLYVVNQSLWMLPAGVGILISQILIFNYWKYSKYGSIANIIILIIGVIEFSTLKYFQKYQAMVKSELREHDKIAVELLNDKDILHLPPPVQKYLRYSGAIGKPKVHNFKLTFEGRIRKNEESEWMNFTSVQYNFMDKPTRLFFMKAIMKQLPVAGFHCYQSGKAYMDIRLLSLIKVQFMDGPNMDTAETVTFFNDMCCMAPATLIDKRIRWFQTKDNQVEAAFTCNNISVAATLFFNDSGQLINFISENRFSADAGRKLPWSTPLKNYKTINNFHLAGYAETIYHYPGKDLCYGQFQLNGIEYNMKN